MIILQPMTTYELLSLIISVAGFVTVIISIIMLIRQTREMTLQTNLVAESLRTATYEAVASQMFAIDEIFIRYPELRPYFYSGKDISENDPDYDKVVAIAEFILDFFGSVLLQMQHFPQVWPRKWWEEYFIDSFANSPVLCRYLESVKEWYIDDLIKLMGEGERRRQQSKATLEGSRARGASV